MTESSKLHNNYNIVQPSAEFGEIASRADEPNRLYPKPLVSVIIPVYNVAKVLERCVDSVRQQTYRNLEIILVDDGSTDMSGKFCDVFAKKDARIKVVHQPNQGLSAARNAGINLATGKYFTFVDSDDVAHPDLVTALYQLLHNSQTLMSIGSFTEVYPNGRRQDFSSLARSNMIQPPKSSQPQQLSELPQSTRPSQTSELPQSSQPQHSYVLSTVQCLTAMLCEDGFTMSACSKLYARELFDQVRFPVGKLHEDVGTTYKLIEQCARIAVTSISLYDYYQNDNSIIHQNFTKRKLDLIELTDQMCDELTANFLTPASQNRTPNPEQHASVSENHTPASEKRTSSIQNHAPSSADLSNLSNAIKKRRMHARFSILRQMVMVKPKAMTMAQNGLTSSDFRKFRRRTVRYLHKHKNYILKNPLSTRRDLFAMRSLQLGLPFFKFAWQTYIKRRQNTSQNIAKSP